MKEFARLDVLGHRMVVQHLNTPTDRAEDCGPLAIGMQDTPVGSARIGLFLRSTRMAGDFAVVMAVRGAPHLVRRAELPLFRAALLPEDERAAAEIDAVAQAMRKVANGNSITRPALSEALNDEVADALRIWCDRCAARHVREGLFRIATLYAGLELDPDAESTTFRPSGDWSIQPDHQRARVELARRFVHLVGVATPADLATWLGRKSGEVRGTWQLLDLTPCVVDGKRRWALTEDLPSLSNPPRPSGAKLLPPSDAYLLGDRFLLLPDRDHQRQLWRAVSSPGAILLNGEVTGTWRHHPTGPTLTPFHPLTTTMHNHLTHEAKGIPHTF